MVVDASLALSWCFSTEATPATDALLDRVALEGMVVPNLWHLEVANVLQSGIRKGRITPMQRNASLADLAELVTEVDTETCGRAWSATLGLADTYGLTIYDAAYLELALRRALPLASLDKQLVAAAQQTGVTALP